MVKKSKKSSRSKHNRIVFGIVVAVVAIAAASVLVRFAIIAHDTSIVNDRKDRIVEIYDSIKIDEQEYLLRSADVFGQKRIYEWDNSRSYSSHKEYTRGANVDVTVADLDGKIEAAGFTEIEEPYPGSLIIQKHYKSAKNEYVRLTVSSKPRDDAFFNANLMKNDISGPGDMDANASPSNVTIKVNLDDNNE